MVTDHLHDLDATEFHSEESQLSEKSPQKHEQWKIVSKLVPSSGLLLDVGCYNGSISQYLHGIEYMGVDVNRRAVEEARRKGIDVLLASCDFLPFKNELFDACSLIEVIEHLYFPGKAVKEAYRILKPGGKLIVGTPNLANFIDRVNLLIGENIVPGLEQSQHVRFFTWKSLNSFLRRNGFELEERRTWYLQFPLKRMTDKYPSWRKAMRLPARLLPNLDKALHGRWRKIQP
jgi:SAM-dependent methyltransferase